MQCVVLAGGLATRMRPITERIPKSLLPINGVPFIHFQLDLLRSQKIERVCLLIAHLGSQIRDYVGDGSKWGFTEVRFIDEGDRLLGTGGALRNALDEGALNENFFLLYGDSYLPVGFAPLWVKLQNSDADISMMVLRNEGEWDKSNVAFDASTGRVLYDKFYQSAPPEKYHFIDFGLMAMRSDWIQREIPSGVKVDLAECLFNISSQGRVVGVETDQRFYEVGSHKGLVDFRDFVNTI